MYFSCFATSFHTSIITGFAFSMVCDAFSTVCGIALISSLTAVPALLIALVIAHGALKRLERNHPDGFAVAPDNFASIS